jgi:4-hydroxy 2-oxovalerate aldolase
MKHPSVMDCTFRDGGYYCRWDFDSDLATKYIRAIAASGIEYAEVGYRSADKSGFGGRYKFCTDSHLSDLLGTLDVKLAVMIDGKDFIRDDDAVDEEGLRQLFRPRIESPVEMVRITSTTDTLEPVIAISVVLRELGYAVSVNVMKASLLTPGEVAAAASRLNEASVDVLYLADSFGGLAPRDTAELIAAAAEEFDGVIGFHGHDNMGLALANSIAAADAGAGLIDCSVSGMGRGAGNLKTEQLLLYLAEKEGREDLDAAPFFELISSEFADLQERYRWGASLPYMLAGVYNVHPSYAQNMLQVPRYSPMEVIRVLEAARESRAQSSFDTDKLSEFLMHRFRNLREAAISVADLPGLEDLPRPEDLGSRPILLIGSGPSVVARSAEINRFIEAHDPVVVECNYQPAIRCAKDHYSLFTNYGRLKEKASLLREGRSRVVLGLRHLEAGLAELMKGMTVQSYPYRLQEGTFEINDTDCVVPYDVVGVFAFAWCLRLRPNTLFLCGYDGYVGNGTALSPVHAEEAFTAHREMEAFLRMVRDNELAQKTSIVSLTPTTYDLVQQSIYAYAD